MTIYLIVSILAIIVSVFIFFDSIIISSGSICPIVLIGLSILQAIIFKSEYNEPKDHTNATNYSTREMDYEVLRLSMKYHTLTKIAIIPLLCVFIIYFNTVIKIAVPICIYLLSFFPVPLLVKYSKKR